MIQIYVGFLASDPFLVLRSSQEEKGGVITSCQHDEFFIWGSVMLILVVSSSFLSGRG